MPVTKSYSDVNPQIISDLLQSGNLRDGDSVGMLYRKPWLGSDAATVTYQALGKLLSTCDGIFYVACNDGVRQIVDIKEVSSLSITMCD